MNIHKITQLSIKLGRTQKYKKPEFFYQYIIKEKFISDFFKDLTGKEIVFLCFMASAISKGLDLSKLGDLFENLERNIFTFSISEVIDDSPMETCSSCGGDGEVGCRYCDSTGEVECEECGGSGKVEDDEGNDINCDNCDGDGQLNCDECNKGYIQCDDCDGNGEVEKEGYISLNVREYVSYDSDIFNDLEILEDDTKIEYDLVGKIIRSELTFEYRHYDTDTDGFTSEANRDDFYFTSMQKYPEFNRSNKGFLMSNLPHWF